MMHGHWNIDEPFADDDDMADAIQKSMNTEIAIAVPACIIHEFLDHSEFVKDQRELDESLNGHNIPALD